MGRLVLFSMYIFTGKYVLLIIPREKGFAASICFRRSKIIDAFEIVRHGQDNLIMVQQCSSKRHLGSIVEASFCEAVNQ